MYSLLLTLYCKTWVCMYVSIKTTYYSQYSTVLYSKIGLREKLYERKTGEDTTLYWVSIVLSPFFIR